MIPTSLLTASTTTAASSLPIAPFGPQATPSLQNGVATDSTGTVLNKEQSEWTQHITKDGRAFWNNTKTGKSSWDKPDCLKSELELLTSSQTPWKEYVSADGRQYWYNKETKKSVWDIPEDIRQLKQELAEEWSNFTDKTLATERLKTLFKLKNLGPKTRWEDALNTVKSDSRFSFFSCLSTGEKKQAFSEFQNQIQKHQRDRDRVRKVEGRQIFLDELGKWPPLTPASVLQDFENAYKSEWWMSCFSLSEKEDLFNEYIEEWEPVYWEKYRIIRKKQRIAILDFLRTSSKISIDLSWREVASILLEQKELKGAEPKDYLSCWEEYYHETENRERQERKKRVQRSRRKRREAFRKLIQKDIQDGNLNARVSFASFIERRRDHPDYLGLLGVPISTPREIFDSETESLINIYEAEKQILKTILRTHDEIRVTSTTTYDEFLASLKCSEEAKQILMVNARLFYDSLKRRAIRREREKREASREVEHRSENDDDSRRVRYNHDDDERESTVEESKRERSLHPKRSRDRNERRRSSDGDIEMKEESLSRAKRRREDRYLSEDAPDGDDRRRDRSTSCNSRIGNCSDEEEDRRKRKKKSKHRYESY